MILLRNYQHMLEAYRRNAKSFHGDKYRNRVAPYISIIRMHMKHNPKHDPVTAAQELVGLMKGKRTKVPVHVRALIYSAGLDLRDGDVAQ